VRKPLPPRSGFPVSFVAFRRGRTLVDPFASQLVVGQHFLIERLCRHEVIRVLLALDDQASGVKHVLKVNRTVRRDGFAQRARRRDHSQSRRLAVIPFNSIVGAIGTHNAVLGGNVIPQLGLFASRPADTCHVYGESIRMKRIEFIRKASNAKCGRAIS